MLVFIDYFKQILYRAIEVTTEFFHDVELNPFRFFEIEKGEHVSVDTGGSGKLCNLELPFAHKS
jgi:hypothetical protein